MKYCEKMFNSCCGEKPQCCGCCGCGHDQMYHDPDFELQLVPEYSCGCKPHVAPPCLKPCWDTCKCMDEIMQLKGAVQDLTRELSLLKGRVKQNEATEKNHYEYLLKLIGDLTEKVENYYNELKELITNLGDLINNKYQTLINEINENSLWTRVGKMLRPKKTDWSVTAYKFFDSDPNI